MSSPKTLISLDINDTRAVRALKGVVGHFYRSSTQINQSLEVAGKGWRLFSAPARQAISLFASATTAALAFSGAVTEVTTISDLPAQQIAAIAKDLNTAYGGGLQAKTKAIYQTISAGITDATGATALLDTASKLAVGGVTNLTTSVDGLTSVVNAYAAQGLSARDASDVMFVAIRDGKTTAEELSTTLGQVAPIASQLGVPFADLAAAIATVTTNGVATAEAVTQVRSALIAVTKQTPKAQAVAKDLGIDFSLAALQSKGLSRFLREVVVESGATQEQLVELFGRVEGLAAALALTSNDGEKFNQILRDMDDRAGATDVAFGKMSDTLGFQINRFDGLKNAAAVALGETTTESENARRGMAGLNKVTEDLVTFLGGDEGKRAVNAFFRELTTGFQVAVGATSTLFDVLGALGSDSADAVAQQMRASVRTMERYISGAQDGLNASTKEWVAELARDNAAIWQAGLPPEEAWRKVQENYFKATEVGGQDAYDLLTKLERDYLAEIQKRSTAAQADPKAQPVPEKLAKGLSFGLADTDPLFDLRTIEDEAFALATRIRTDMAGPIDEGMARATLSLASGSKKVATGATKFFQGLRSKLGPEIDALAGAMSGSIASGLSGMFAELGQGANVLQSLKSFFGGVMIQLGGLLIQLGTAGVVAGTLGTLVPALAGITGGPLGIAGGLAAIAAGGVMVAAGSALGGRGSAAPAGGGGRGGGASRDTGNSGSAAPRVSLPGRDDLLRGRGRDGDVNVNVYITGTVGNPAKAGLQIADTLRSADRLRFGGGR